MIFLVPHLAAHCSNRCLYLPLATTTCCCLPVRRCSPGHARDQWSIISSLVDTPFRCPRRPNLPRRACVTASTYRGLLDKLGRPRPPPRCVLHAPYDRDLARSFSRAALRLCPRAQTVCADLERAERRLYGTPTLRSTVSTFSDATTPRHRRGTPFDIVCRLHTPFLAPRNTVTSMSYSSSLIPSSPPPCAAQRLPPLLIATQSVESPLWLGLLTSLFAVDTCRIP